MPTNSTQPTLNCGAPTPLNNPCVTQMLKGFDPATMTYEGDIPCVPPDRALDCSTLGVSTIASILDTRQDFDSLVSAVQSQNFIDTLINLSNII